MKVDNYVTIEEFHVGNGMDAILIPKGTHVKPIDARWLPEHIKQGSVWATIKDKLDYWTYTYSSYGIHPIPKKFIAVI